RRGWCSLRLRLDLGGRCSHVRCLAPCPWCSRLRRLAPDLARSCLMKFSSCRTARSVMPVLSPAVARSSSTVLLLLLGSLFLSLRQRLARITRCSHPFRLAHRWWCSLFSRLAPTARCSCIRWLAPSLRCSLLLRLAPTT